MAGTLCSFVLSKFSKIYVYSFGTKLFDYDRLDKSLFFVDELNQNSLFHIVIHSLGDFPYLRLVPYLVKMVDRLYDK